MKLSIQAEHLKSAFSRILSVVDQKNSRPILTYCLLTAKDNSLCLEATDLEVSCKIIYEAEVLEDGKLCVNPKSLFDLFREMPNRPIHLETSQKDNLLKLSSGEIKVSLITCSSEDFPALSFVESEEEFELEGKNILNFIAKTSHAMSNDQTRIFLNGIFLQQTDSKLRVVATNGYTFALLDSKGPPSTYKTLLKGIIIPKKGVAELKKFVEQENNSKIKISVDESFIYVGIGNKDRLSIRLIARDYPPYKTVIPSKTLYSMTVSRDHLLSAIRRVKVLSNEKSNAIKLSMDKDKLSISASHPVLGEANEKLDIDYTGKCMSIGFNARYIMDSLSVFEDGDIIFKFNNNLSPVIIKSPKLQEFFSIVMPLKI